MSNEASASPPAAGADFTASAVAAPARRGWRRRPSPARTGREIQARVCADCWAEWRRAEVMVINELRLNFMDPASQEILDPPHAGVPAPARRRRGATARAPDGADAAPAAGEAGADRAAAIPGRPR